MGDIVTLYTWETRKKCARKDFVTVLERPLNLGLGPTAKEKPKKRSLYKRLRWAVVRRVRPVYKATFRAALDWHRRREGIRLAGELATLAMPLNREDFHVFVNFSGHVNGLDVHVYAGGWDQGRGEKTRVLTGPLPGFSSYGKMRLRDLREAKKLIVSLSKMNRARCR